jgi:hypothetical protein
MAKVEILCDVLVGNFKAKKLFENRTVNEMLKWITQL